MRSSFEDRLIQYYPALFPATGETVTDAKIHRIQCGKGWFPLIEMLCDQAQDVIDDQDLRQATICEISEKFGLMRVSCYGSSEPVRQLIDAAERASAEFCEFCGGIGITQRTRRGWIKTLCVVCKTSEPIL
ncbi:hypothetical protein [Pseudomonas syringae group genomosp. 3]|uniref:hypothetical protein n=1 Tax=Pseudomonas syringae group genomosp. 3 TaxID=251701 RepID=UPI000EFE4089|nr:hypothetical protein [Pseudomonas syringae group genomosp. 3]